MIPFKGLVAGVLCCLALANDVHPGFRSPAEIPAALIKVRPPARDRPGQPLLTLTGTAVLDREGNVGRLWRDPLPGEAAVPSDRGLIAYMTREQVTSRPPPLRHAWMGSVDPRALDWVEHLVLRLDSTPLVNEPPQCVDCDVVISLHAYQGARRILIQSEGEVGARRVGAAPDAIAQWFNRVVDQFAPDRMRFVSRD